MAHDWRGDPGRRLMINITFTVHLEGREPFEVVTKVRDIVNFENHFGLSSQVFAGRPIRNADGSVPTDENGKPLRDASHIQQVWFNYLAYSACKRRGEFSGTFDEFNDALDDIPAVMAQAAAVPTNAEA